MLAEPVLNRSDILDHVQRARAILLGFDRGARGGLGLLPDADNARVVLEGASGYFESAESVGLLDRTR